MILTLFFAKVEVLHNKKKNVCKFSNVILERHQIWNVKMLLLYSVFNKKYVKNSV